MPWNIVTHSLQSDRPAAKYNAVTLNLYDAMVRQMTGMHFAVQTFALVSLKLNNRSIHLVHCSDVQTDTVHC